MPIEIRRFGVGHRRPEGPPGTARIQGQVVHSDGRGVISELAFARGGAIAPHANPNTTYFLVIEGGGWVSVAGERQRIQAGEAAVWPADLTHAAWTEHTTMRAIVIEFAGADDVAALGILAGTAREIGPTEEGLVERGEGALAPRPPDATKRRDAATSEGEPI
ncbi:MAG: cupin domain-containing protein [Chloroflexota bacterium]